MKTRLELEELRNVVKGLRSDGPAGIARVEEDAIAAANTAISLLQAVELLEQEIEALKSGLEYEMSEGRRGERYPL